VEAEALTDITANKVISFFMENIICRFGIPKMLITDNGTQFDNQKIREQCERLQIDHMFFLISHPQTNGQAELTNRVLLNGLKKKIKEAKSEWTELLNEILWAYRTTTKTKVVKIAILTRHGKY
jgi:transposase InsO family protein